MSKKIVIIGGGPGGYICAIRAAQLGADVTVVEKDSMGGTCLNRGCIPTKSILHSTLLWDEVKRRGREIGIDAADAKLDFGQVIKHKNTVVKRMVRGVEGLMKTNGVQVLRGSAAFNTDKKSITVRSGDTEQVITADAFVIATGSVNAVPPIPGLKESRYCVDSTAVLAMEEAPDSMVVIGAGVIGLELAAAFCAAGTKVTVIEAMDKALPMLDEEIADAGLTSLRKKGVDIHMSVRAERIEDTDSGAKVICSNSEGQEEVFEAPVVLVAVGRRANTKALCIENAGINNDRGAVIVDSHMSTNVQGIYAIGDCVSGHAQLAHTASAMGEVAAENIMGIRTEYDESTCPSCVYIDPETASVGLTETAAVKAGYKVNAGRFPMMANGKAVIENGGEGLVKIISEESSGKVLGMHIIGPRAADLISEGALAIRMDATIGDIISTIHSHPTVSETVREAALDSEGRALNMPPARK